MVVRIAHSATIANSGKLRNVTIDAGSPVPVYRQLAEILRAKITSGELAPRSRLSVRSLMREYEVSQASVTHALAILREESLIVSVVGKGSYVV